MEFSDNKCVVCCAELLEATVATATDRGFCRGCIVRFVCEVCLFVCLSILFLDFLPFYLILWFFYGLGSASVFEKDELDRIEINVKYVSIAIKPDQNRLRRR